VTREQVTAVLELCGTLRSANAAASNIFGNPQWRILQHYVERVVLAVDAAAPGSLWKSQFL
jgi:hypothetical protein